MAIKDDIKSLLSKNGITLTSVVEQLNSVNEETTTVQNLSNKLNRNTIKYVEVEQILNIIGYTINFEPMNTHLKNHQFSQLKHSLVSEGTVQYGIDFSNSAFDDIIKNYIDKSMVEAFSKITNLVTKVEKRKYEENKVMDDYIEKQFLNAVKKDDKYTKHDKSQKGE